MARKGWTLGIIVASIALLAVVVLLSANPAGATINGKQPPASGDWVIDQDTTVLGEKITIYGKILVDPGYSLSVRNSQIEINSTYAGENGIHVQANSTHHGSLTLNDTSVRADYSDFGYYFWIDGAATISNNVRLYDVHDGLGIYWTDQVYIDDLELHAYGRYGMNIVGGDPTVHSSQIYLEVNPGSTGTGLRLDGNSGDRASPDLDDLYIKVHGKDKYETTSSSHSTTFRFHGMELAYCQFDVLSGIEITFEGVIDALFNTTGTPRLYADFYTYAISLYSGSMINAFDEVKVLDSTYFIDADAENVQAGRLYIDSYWYGIRNQIFYDGASPSVLTGLEFRDQMVDWDDNNIFTTVYDYFYGRGVEWFPSSSQMTGDTFTIDNVTFDAVEVERFLDITNYWHLVVKDSNFMNSYIDDHFIYMYRWGSNDVTFQDNVIYNNTMEDDYYFYLRYPDGEINFLDNNITANEYYYMFYIYDYDEEVNFEGNLIMDNEETANRGSYAIWYLYYARKDTTVENNNVTGNAFRYMFYIRYNYAPIEMRDNLFSFNSGQNYMIYTYRMYQEFTFEENWMYNNTLNGVFYQHNNNGAFYIEDNEVVGNQLGTNGFFWCYGEIYSGLHVTDNSFVDNMGTQTIFDFYGIGYWRTIDFEFERNEFINNSASTATNGGIIYFYRVRQDWSVRDNYFENNSANCIVTYLPWFRYYYSPNHYWFRVQQNEFYNNTGKCIVFTEIDNNNIEITQNKGSGNEDYPIYVDHSKGYIWDWAASGKAYTSYMYGITQGPDYLRVESNNFSWNPGGGAWLKTSQYDPERYYYNPGNPGQEILVKKNRLVGNGPDGWSLALAGIYKKPSVKRNVLDNSSMGMYWELINEDNRRNEFDMEIRDVHMNGGDDGMTAYGFREIDAVFYDCVFENYEECFYAADCEVNVWSSAVPEASGKTEDKGKIFIWNYMEIWVNWANAEGVDSGVPVEGAVIAVQGANGKYLEAKITDDEGKLEPMLMNPWTSDDGVMDAWSPFVISVMSKEISTVHNVHLVGDYIDPNPMRLPLIDFGVPEVIISNPQDGTLVNTMDVLTEGFLFELGSGIERFEGTTDEMGGDWEPIATEVLWQHVFEGMAEGEHNLSVRAADIAGNWNTSNISIIVDLEMPSLEVRMEYLDTTPIPYNETLEGYFVRDKEIAINGTYDDNYADLRDIIIRINGVPEYIFASQLGKIYKRVKLDQGINTLIVDATDTAGNRHTERLYISLDSYAPTLYIYSPLQGEKTGDELMAVTGLTEPSTRLDFIVQASAGTNTYVTASGEDGNFEFDVDLFEGIQKILVTATDSAGNPTTETRDVTLDTTPPDFIVNSPPRERLITKETRYEIVGTMTFEPDADIYIRGQWVPNTGVFSDWVILEEGENPIDIKAIDKVGNENIKYVYISRDTEKPEFQVDEPVGDFLLTRETKVHFEGTVSGAEKVVIVHKSIPQEATIGEDGAWEYDLQLGQADLEQYIDVKAVDEAGNEVIHTVHVILDIVKPTLNVDDIPETTKRPLVWLNGTTDVAILEVFINGVKYQVKDGEFTVQWPLNGGTNNIDIGVSDEAGNEATDTKTVEYVPPKPPEPGTTDEDGGFSSIWGIALLIAAITIIVTAFIVTSQRTGRR